MKSSTTTTVLRVIQWRYRSADRLCDASGIFLADLGDRYKVELLRNGNRSGTVLEIDKAHVLKFESKQTDDAVVSDPAITDRFKFGAPNDQQLTQINSYLPNGATPLTTKSVITVPFIAADNLLTRSLDRWSIESLQAMANLLPGLPCTLDHDWDDTAKEWGRIYNAEMVLSRSAPDAILNRAGNLDQNRQIVGSEGLAQVVFEVFAPTDSPVVKALSQGHSGSISTGGFRFQDYECPVCDCSFDDPECPHIPPYPMWGIFPDEEEGVAPYATRTGLFDMGEASVVTIPNLPNAGVIR